VVKILKQMNESVTAVIYTVILYCQNKIKWNRCWAYCITLLFVLLMLNLISFVTHLFLKSTTFELCWLLRSGNGVASVGVTAACVHCRSGNPSMGFCWPTQRQFGCWKDACTSSSRIRGWQSLSSLQCQCPRGELSKNDEGIKSLIWVTASRISFF